MLYQKFLGDKASVQENVSESEKSFSLLKMVISTALRISIKMSQQKLAAQSQPPNGFDLKKCMLLFFEKRSNVGTNKNQQTILYDLIIKQIVSNRS
jgi:hypothetical protein